MAVAAFPAFLLMTFQISVSRQRLKPLVFIIYTPTTKAVGFHHFYAND
jgi:hypothetical protein